MGLFELILIGMAYMTIGLLDIIAIFLVIRMVATRANSRWLAAFDSAGRPLVSMVMQLLQDVAFSRIRKPISERLQLGLALGMVLFVRMGIAFLFSRGGHA